jgi:hypothetical protein
MAVQGSNYAQGKRQLFARPQVWYRIAVGQYEGCLRPRAEISGIDSAGGKKGASIGQLDAPFDLSLGSGGG